MYRSLILIFFISLLVFTTTIFNTKKISNSNASDIKKSVFKLLSISEENNLYTATGFVFKKRNNKSFILTNHHFCEITDGGIFLIQNDEEYKRGDARIAEVEYSSEEVDLCIASTISMEEPLGILDKDLKFSDKLYTIGAPDGNFPMYFDLRFSSYIDKEVISDYFPRLKTKYNSFFVTGFIETGQSGSPVLNEKGEVVGVIFAKTGNGTGIVIPSKEALDFISGFFSY